MNANANNMYDEQDRPEGSSLYLQAELLNKFPACGRLSPHRPDTMTADYADLRSILMPLETSRKLAQLDRKSRNWQSDERQTNLR